MSMNGRDADIALVKAVYGFIAFLAFLVSILVYYGITTSAVVTESSPWWALWPGITALFSMMVMGGALTLPSRKDGN